MVLNKFPRSNGEVIDADDANQSFYQGTLKGTMNYGTIDVLATATLIKAEDSDRLSILIRNNGSGEITIGFADTVVVGSGIPLVAGESIYLRTRTNIYGIGVDASNDIRFLEVTL